MTAGFSHVDILCYNAILFETESYTSASHQF